jgi:hypothetical protein
MEDQRQEKDDAHIGDKVRIRSGPHAKERGVVQAKVGEFLEIQLDTGPRIQAGPLEITNYSLAARGGLSVPAQSVMPKHAGRHQLAVPRKKMVSLRLDIDVLDDLAEATELGLIPNKEQAVNTWLRQQLDLLFRDKPRSDATQE